MCADADIKQKTQNAGAKHKPELYHAHDAAQHQRRKRIVLILFSHLARQWAKLHRAFRLGILSGLLLAAGFYGFAAKRRKRIIISHNIAPDRKMTA